jgi:DNA-binding NtrC family response regulator
MAACPDPRRIDLDPVFPPQGPENDEGTPLLFRSRKIGPLIAVNFLHYFQRKHMSPISLLIVDDEQEFTEIIAQRLRKRGFTVTTAINGETALGCLQDSIDVVVLDVAMPGMNGIETLNAIRDHHPLVEVIMLTGQATVDTAVEAIKRGAFNYLMKPCEIDDLVFHIEEALKRKRDRESRILEIRMMPYLSAEKRKEMMAEILEKN